MQDAFAIFDANRSSAQNVADKWCLAEYASWLCSLLHCLVPFWSCAASAHLTWDVVGVCLPLALDVVAVAFHAYPHS